MKSFLGGLTTFAVAVALTSAAALALALGYSMVVCPHDNPVGWALLDFLAIFLVAPGLLAVYVIAIGVVTATLGPMRERCGIFRMAWVAVAGFAGLMAVSAGGSALLGLTARCSFGF